MKVLYSSDQHPSAVLAPLVFGFAVLTAAAFLASTGCTSSNSGGIAQPEANSVFGEASIPLRAVVITRAQKPVPLESLAIHASPASKVARLFRSASEEHTAKIISLQKEIDEATATISAEESRLTDAKQAVADKYNRKVPDKETLEAKKRSRDRLEVLSELAAQKSKADEWLEETLAASIRPIEQHIEELRETHAKLMRKLEATRAGFNTLIFEALPKSPTKTWVTDANGFATLAVPKEEPWYVWASTSRTIPGLGSEKYRWILSTAEDLDSSGKLFMDHRNLLDGRGLALDESTGLLRTNTVIERPSY